MRPRRHRALLCGPSTSPLERTCETQALGAVESSGVTAGQGAAGPAKRIGQTPSMPPWLLIPLVLVALLGPIAYIAVGLTRSVQQDHKDIMEHGHAATGTVVAVKRDAIRGGWMWTLTIEFTVPDRSDPVRFEAQASQAFFLHVPQRVKELPQGQSVAVHYRDKWPSLAVIDSFAQ